MPDFRPNQTEPESINFAEPTDSKSSMKRTTETHRLAVIIAETQLFDVLVNEPFHRDRITEALFSTLAKRFVSHFFEIFVLSLSLSFLSRKKKQKRGMAKNCRNYAYTLQELTNMYICIFSWVYAIVRYLLLEYVFSTAIYLVNHPYLFTSFQFIEKKKQKLL